MVTYRVHRFFRVQARFLNKETKILFPCYAIRLLSKPKCFIKSSGMACHRRFPSHHYLILQMQLQFTVACSWAFLPKPWVWPDLLSFRHKWKTCSPAPFVKLIWAKWQSRRCSSLQYSVFCTIAVLALDVSLTTEAEFMNLQFSWGGGGGGAPHLTDCKFT